MTTNIADGNGTVVHTIDDGTPPTVQQAWSAVMRDVSSLAKGDRNEHQKFNFRGIDAVMNAVGPALRTHGVMVIPSSVDTKIRDVQTTQGKASRECSVTVRYTIFGPDGDSMHGAAPGEAMDAGDKATPKAMSVAFRTFLLQSLCLPTDEPDPDSETHERSTGPTDQQQAQDTADRAAKATDPVALQRVAEWVTTKGLDDITITVGDKTGPLGRYMAKRIADLKGPDPDADAAAQKILEESLGAQEIKDATAAGPTPDGIHQ